MPAIICDKCKNTHRVKQKVSFDTFGRPSQHIVC